MKKIIKNSVISGYMIIAIAAPLQNIHAETRVFSGTGAYANASGYSDNLSLSVYVFENTNKIKNDKSSYSGADVYGNYYDGNYSYSFRNFSTSAIKFKTTKGTNIPKEVIASGTVSGEWTYCDWDTGNCYAYPDTISFSINASSSKDQGSRSYGTNHYEYPGFKENYHYDYTNRSVNLSSSLITSSMLNRTVNISWGNIGISKSHYVDITK